jgi:hypothetical protein
MKLKHIPLCLFLVSCASSPTISSSNLTHGQVQKSLSKGVTTQTEVLEAFGAPNVTSRDGQGCEIWTYQRHATNSKSNSVFGFGFLPTALVGGESRGGESSTRSITLIVKFNSQKIVSDFNSLYQSF